MHRIEVEPDVPSGLAAMPMKPGGDIRHHLTWLCRCAVIIVSVCLAPWTSAAVWPLTGALGAHDPTVLKDGTVWWCFTTGTGLPAKFSSDGLYWEQRTPLFSAEDSWWRTYAPTMGNLDVWAPDARAYNGRIWCYYCVSEFGKNNSAIGLLSCTSVAAGDWRDDGFVLGSKAGTDAYNALDPSLATDALGNPWLVFGSWFDGIHLVPLDPTTMKPSGPMVSLAKRANGIEGANIVYANGYYYLFVSIDRCCLGVNSTYKIAVGRATAITGPYYDKSGVAMLNGGGTIFDSGNSRWIGPGGENVSQVGDGWIIARHAYDAQANGAPTLLISDLYWDADHWPTYSGPSAPTITQQPISATVAPGGTVALIVAAAGENLTYQWSRNGTTLPGATGTSLNLGNVQASDSGQYSVTVSNSTAAIVSRTATLTVATPALGRVINLSVRAHAATSDQTLIAGFVVSGSAPKAILVRGIGPTLMNLGVPDPLPDPHLDLFAGQAVIASDDSWMTATNLGAIASMGGDKFAGYTLDAKDTVLLQTVASRDYTAQIRDAANGQGVALMEVYDADPAESPGSTAFAAQSGLINVSGRAQVGTGADILIAGFVVNGNVPRRLLVRGIGPGLAPLGVNGVLADPQLRIFDSQQNIVAQNDNWPAAENAAAIRTGGFDAFAGRTLDEREAVLLITLPSGGYTAQVSGADGGTGVALVEVTEEP